MIRKQAKKWGIYLAFWIINAVECFYNFYFGQFGYKIFFPQLFKNPFLFIGEDFLSASGLFFTSPIFLINHLLYL